MAISEFQWSLVGAGAIAVGGVWAYNLWQERKHRKAAERVFRGQQADVLLASSDQPEPGHVPLDDHAASSADDAGDNLADSPAKTEWVADQAPAPTWEERREPVIPAAEEIDAGQIQAVVEQAAPAPMIESSPAALSGVFPPPATPGVVAIPEPDEHLADRMVELVVEVAPANPVAASRLWESVNGLEGRVAKKMRWIAWSGREWSDLSPQSTNVSLARACVQLADRQGAIGEMELSSFVAGMLKLGADVGASVAVPLMSEVLDHARALDGFCASVDVQIALHVVAQANGFAGTKLRGLLEAAGFVLRPDGLFHLVDDNGNGLMSVSNAGAAPFIADEMRTLTAAGLTFWLDVPRVANGARVFDRMVGLTRQTADTLGGIVVDDRRNPLGDDVLAGIRAKIVEIQDQMAAHQMPSGSHRALRLFV